MGWVLKRASDIHIERLDDIGEGKMSLCDAIAQPEGAPFTAGICEIWHGVPVPFEYDEHCDVACILEGELELEEHGVLLRAGVGDIVYNSQEPGRNVGWHSPSHVKFFYVTYPHWR